MSKNINIQESEEFKALQNSMNDTKKSSLDIKRIYQMDLEEVKQFLEENKDKLKPTQFGKIDDRILELEELERNKSQQSSQEVTGGVINECEGTDIIQDTSDINNDNDSLDIDYSKSNSVQGNKGEVKIEIKDEYKYDNKDEIKHDNKSDIVSDKNISKIYYLNEDIIKELESNAKNAKLTVVKYLNYLIEDIYANIDDVGAALVKFNADKKANEDKEAKERISLFNTSTEKTKKSTIKKESEKTQKMLTLTVQNYRRVEEFEQKYKSNRTVFMSTILEFAFSLMK